MSYVACAPTQKIAGLELVGHFHSHPSGDGSLSAADLAALRHSAWPWVIVTRTCGTPALIVMCYAVGDGRKIAVSIDPLVLLIEAST